MFLTSERHSTHPRFLFFPSTYYDKKCALTVVVLFAGGGYLIFYADVYFLINFTVDIIALYFAAAVSKTPTSVKRLFLLGILGASLATISVLLSEELMWELILSVAYFFLVAMLISRGLSFYRKIKAVLFFAAFEFLIGGLVSFAYEFMDKHFYSFFSNMNPASPNRRLLLLALMVLISVGVFKFFILLFSGTACEKAVLVEVELLGRVTRFEALVDTGNLLKDPVGGLPVIMVKRCLAEKIHERFPFDSSELSSIDRCFLNRISLIPVSSVAGKCIAVGVRVDEIKISFGEKEGKCHTINAVIATDKEGGTYDGYEALMPAAAIDGVK